MSETKKPEYREDDSWFSDAQLDRLAPADHADPLHSPIPTQMVSNGEYMPIGQTDKQKEVEARLAALSAQAAKKLGMSRRKFLTTSGGFAASFIAMNQVFGEFFDVRAIDMLVPQAYAQGAPQGVFVFDDQTHIIRSSRVGPGQRAARHRPGRAYQLQPERPARRARARELSLEPGAGRPAEPELELPPGAVHEGRLSRQPGPGRDHDQQQLGGDPGRRRQPAAAQRRGVGALRDPDR